MKRNSSRKSDAKRNSVQNETASPFAGRPLDGSQYMDVVEEQEYADRRPTKEEQQPRYSYMHHDEEIKKQEPSASVG